MNDSYSPLLSLGWNARWAALLAEVDHPDAAPGRVVRRDRGWVTVATNNGVESLELAGQTEEIVTGDWVAVVEGRVASVLERSGFLRRRTSDGLEQLLAANVDVVLLVCGLDRPVRPGRVHRGAVQAWDAGAEAVVVLNKTDLTVDPQEAADAIAAETFGLEVLPVSSWTGNGLDAVREAIRGRTTVLLGESGAGKSSLLNALAGRPLAAEGEVREGDSKGRHTTTRRELHLLPGGAIVIDTPGIREFGLAATAEAVESAFEDIEELALACRFSNCGHDTEPGCAVKKAVEAGSLRRGRLEAYLRLRSELESQVVRTNPYERRRRDRRFARVVDEAQRAKKGQI